MQKHKQNTLATTHAQSHIIMYMYVCTCHLCRYITQYAPPAVDPSQDIQDKMAEHSNGVTTIKFRRPLGATDAADISLSECRYFLFGWGGVATVATQAISYHATTPIVSQDRICLPSAAQCPEGGCGLVM